MRQKRNLRDVSVDGMALTGSPANGEPFLLYKSADGDQWPEGVEMADSVPEPSAEPQIKAPSDAIAKSIQQIALQKAADADSAVLLQSVGTLLHSIDGVTTDDLLAIAKAAGIEELEKKSKADDEDEADEEDEEEEYDEDEDGEDDEPDENDAGDDEDSDEDEDDVADGKAVGTHPSLPPGINRKANARAKAKKGIKKGGPGSGRYPAGSHGNDSDGGGKSESGAKANKMSDKVFNAKNDTIEAHGAAKMAQIQAASDASKAGDHQAVIQHLSAANQHSVRQDGIHEAGGRKQTAEDKVDSNRASRLLSKTQNAMQAEKQASKTGSNKDHRAAIQAHQSAITALKGNEGREGNMQRSAHQALIRQHEKALGIVFKSLNIADSSAEQGGATMPEDIEKSEERVDLAKAHRDLLQKHEEMVARLEKTEKELHEQRDAALLKSVQDEVAREYGSLSCNKGELATMLKHAREQKDPAHHESMVKMLKALNAQAQMSANGSLFKSSAHTPAFSMATGEGSSMQRLDAMIDARLEKSDVKKSRGDVFMEVVNTPEGRALWAENLQEGRN